MFTCCSHLVRGTFNWNEGTNIDPCILSEFSAWVRTEPVFLSLSPPHYKAAAATIKIVPNNSFRFFINLIQKYDFILQEHFMFLNSS